MVDIAPLGFAIDTSGLEKGANALRQFEAAGGKAADAAVKFTAAQLAELKASRDAAEQAAKTAAAKLNLLKATDGVKDSAIREAKALADSAKQTAIAASAKYDLARAGQSASAALDGVTKSGGVAGGVMAGVAREAAAMATNMGMGGAAGRLGVAGAMGAAQGAAARLAPQMALVQGTMGKVGLGAGAAAAAYIALTASIADNQDRWASYQQQLANSLGSQGAATASLRAVVDMANEVGISVDTALTSFNRFARVKGEIGATNDELLLMTETIMKLGRASGVETGAMQGAMMQLSQALASGRLNGDELRSIMENMQPLAKAIAEGLGVGVGELRRMGAEGELTGEKIFRSLLGQAEKADAAFAKMPTTVEQAKTRMANQWDELAAHMGEVLEASGVQQFFLNLAGGVADGLNKGFRTLANDGLTEAAVKLKEIEERSDGAAQRMRTWQSEFNKQFNKDLAKQRDLQKEAATAQDKLTTYQQAMATHEQRLALAQRAQIENAGRIAALQRIVGGEIGRRNPAAAADAKKELDNLLAPVRTAEKVIRDTKDGIQQTQNGLEEINRQYAELARNDPFEKLTQQAVDLQDAMTRGGGGMVSIWTEALGIARQTRNTVEGVVNEMVRLKTLQLEQQIGDTSGSASIQRGLAAALAGGENKLTAEATAEAAQKAFETFGDTLGTNREIIQRYTASLIEMKLAMQAVGDAAEITRLKTQLSELAGLTAAVTSGTGGFAERLARHQSGISAFQQERAGQVGSTAGTTVSAGSGRAGLPQHIVDFFARKGAPTHVAQGIAAGIMSESSGNPGAINPTSGAYGYGQWLGSRRTGLNRRYGPMAGGQQQLEYLWWELNGGDRGGPSVLSAGSAQQAAANYIANFMRPGKDTPGGIRRALGYLGGGTAAVPGAAGAAGTDYTGQIVGLRNDVFAQENALQAQRFLQGQSMAMVDANSRRQALRDGGPEALRQLELELKVQQAINDNDPIFAKQIEAAVTDADAAERRFQAEQKIYELRVANDNAGRRNDAARTGDPAVMRQLELELRIEEIRRTAPATEQGRLIGEERRAFSLESEGIVAKRSAEAQNATRSLQEQVKLIGLIGEEERIQNRLLQEREALRAAGAVMTGEELAMHLSMVEVLERQNIALERQLENWAAIKSTGRETAEKIGAAFSEFFGQMTRTGELNWQSMMGSIEEAFYAALDRMVQQFVISPIVNFLTGLATSGLNALFGGGSGIPASVMNSNNGSTAPITYTATGRVFNDGNPVPFGGGGIFNTPTGFFMPGGGRGLAGEGPGLYEAIVPLRRGADGKLGIAGGGGGGASTQVNVYDMRSSGSSDAVEIQERETGDGMRQINVMVRDAVKGHVRRGSFDSDFRGSYGTKRQVARR